MNCAYPGCTTPASLYNIKARRDFCAGHESTLCFFSQTQPSMCSALVIPRSSFCKLHDVEVVRFEFLHSMMHQRMAESRQAQREANQVMGDLKHNGLFLR